MVRCSPVKALLAVLAEAEVSDADIDAFIAAFEVPAAADDEAEAGSAFEWAEVDGIRVRWARRGPEQGVPVLFVHGFGGDLGNWLFNLDTIAETMPVIALDLPGHGQSDARLPGTSLAALADWVAHFLDHIGVACTGSGIRWAARSARSSRWRMRPGWRRWRWSGAGLGAEIDAGYIDGFVQAASRRELKPVVEKLFADPSLVSRQLLDDLLRYKRIDGVTELLTALAAALFGGGRQAELPATKLPATGLPLLVVWGEADQVIPAAHAGAAPAGATVAVLSGAGHMVMMEKAGEVNALLRKHLAG